MISHVPKGLSALDIRTSGREFKLSVAPFLYQTMTTFGGDLNSGTRRIKKLNIRNFEFGLKCVTSEPLAQLKMANHYSNGFAMSIA